MISKIKAGYSTSVDAVRRLMFGESSYVGYDRPLLISVLIMLMVGYVMSYIR